MVTYQHQTYHFSKNNTFFIKRHKGKMSPNWHNTIEFLFFLKDGLEINLNGKIYNAKEGDLIVVNSSILHSAKITGEPDYYFLIASDEFFINNNLYSDKTFFTPQINSEETREIFTKIISESEKQDEFSNLLVTAYLMELFTLLNRKYLQSDTSIFLENSKKLSMIRNTIKYLQDHFTEKLSADSVSQALAYSKSYLSHSFKEITNHSLMEYVNLLRCQRARTMLLDDYSIKETATLCGFNDVSYFSRAFKKTMGILPSQVSKEIFTVYI